MDDNIRMINSCQLGSVHVNAIVIRSVWAEHALFPIIFIFIRKIYIELLSFVNARSIRKRHKRMNMI